MLFSGVGESLLVCLRVQLSVQLFYKEGYVLLGEALAKGQESVRCDAEKSGDGGEQADVGLCVIVLPFVDGGGGDAEALRHLRLRESEFFPVGPDDVSDIHSAFLQSDFVRVLLSDPDYRITDMAGKIY